MKSSSLLVVAMLAFAGCGDDSAPGGGGNGGSGGAGGGGADQGGGGGVDGCNEANPCEAGVCLFGDDGCEPGALGTCEPSNGACDGPPTGPVCGCDGEVVEGDFASCSLDNKPYGGPDLCATGTFACGPEQCTNNVQVCVTTIGGPKGAEPSYECDDLGEFGTGLAGQCSGGIADCNCLNLEAILNCTGGGCSCSANEDKQETITAALP